MTKFYIFNLSNKLYKTKRRIRKKKKQNEIVFTNKDLNIKCPFILFLSHNSLINNFAFCFSFHMVNYHTFISF